MFDFDQAVADNAEIVIVGVGKAGIRGEFSKPDWVGVQCIAARPNQADLDLSTGQKGSF